MRVGFDATALAPDMRFTGTGRYVRQLLRHMGEFAPFQELVLYAPPGAPRPEGLPGHFQWRPLPRLPLGKASAFATHMLLLPRLAARDRLDVLHVPAVHPRFSRPPVPRRLPCPLVVTLHDLIPMTFHDPSVEPYPWRIRACFHWNLGALKGASRVITVSQTCRSEIVEHLGVDPRRVVAIHNGIEPADDGSDAEPNPGQDRPREYILALGSSDPRKNLPRLLRAFARAAQSGLTEDLVVVGDGGTSALLPSLDGLRPRVNLLRDVSDTDLRRLYRGATLFVFPSLAEGFGFPPLEAMSEGAPVIASGIPALREVLGQAARFVDARDECALAAAMCELAGDPSRRRSMASAGPAQAALYSWEACARSTLQTYAAATAPAGLLLQQAAR